MTPRWAPRATALVLAVSLALPSVARSQSATIAVYASGGASACPLPLGGTTFTVLEVRLHHTAGPVKTARFKLVPSCPVTPIGPLEFDLTFSPCISDGAIMTLVFIDKPVACADPWGLYFDVVPATGDAKIMLTDCDDYAMVGIDAFRSTDGPPCDDLGGLIAPYRPTPADGATGVPTNTLLSYVGPANAIELSTEPLDFSGFVCGPGCILPPGVVCSYPFDPGLLAPNTTYYWRASNWYPTHDWCDAVWSEEFTFTTGDGQVASESASWGAVKAMYRE